MTIQSILTSDETGAELVTFARQTAQQLVRNNLKRAQIRNIFTEARKIERLWQSSKPTDAWRRLNMLKPKLDYQTARHESVALLRNVLIEAIDEVNKASDEDDKDQRFRRFMELFEAILAYHRSEGGKD